MTKSVLLLALFVSFTITLFIGCTVAPTVQMNKPRLVYNYAKLQLLDLDQMNELIQAKLNKYKETQNNEFLMDAIRICLSRPNGDYLVDKTFDSIRYRANSSENFESATAVLAQWAISELKSPATAPTDQVTYLIMLENLITEMKIEFTNQYQSPRFETRLIEKIASADIIISQSAINESRLNLMTALKSPSVMAQTLINAKNLQLKPKAQVK